MNESNDKRLFWACFVMLMATSFGFVVRTMMFDDWAHEFHLAKTQSGEIQGAWLWPFAISIVLFSLVIDRIGYARAVAFAFVCQVASALVTISARGYWTLYLGNFVGAIGNGTVEAVINPVVATMFWRQKTKWLNILHAGWPGGLVVGGVLAIALGALQLTDWRYKIVLVFIPILIYAVLIVGCRFPVNERVAAGVPYRDMLREAGVLSASVVIALMVRELGRVAAEAAGIHEGDAAERWVLPAQLAVWAILTGIYGLYVRSLGRPLFFLLVLIMMPLATTELGTDSWINPLMTTEMARLGLNAGWLLVYTSFIMMVLRFFAGPLVHKASPLGLLALSSAIAALGFFSLSFAVGAAILAAATLYAFGKSFFWPTMLGVVSEQFPKGGALTLNMISGVGMLGVGILGTTFFGNFQDRRVDEMLRSEDPGLYARVIADIPKMSVFGAYRPLDESKLQSPDGQPLLTATQQQELGTIQDVARKETLRAVAILPFFMLLCYVGLILYFRTRGGYKAEILTGHTAQEEKFLGGVEAAVEG